MDSMTFEELESHALKLDPKERARLAGRLLESLEELSAGDAERLWAAEASRRDAELDEDASAGRQAADVLRDARSRLG